MTLSRGIKWLSDGARLSVEQTTCSGANVTATREGKSQMLYLIDTIYNNYFSDGAGIYMKHKKKLGAGTRYKKSKYVTSLIGVNTGWTDIHEEKVLFILNGS